MSKGISYNEARTLTLNVVTPVSTEHVPLEKSFGRVLAQKLTAAEHVPPFDRSPYDGYAFRSDDVRNAAPDNPITLRIIEEIPAGGISHCAVSEGTAVKVLTGAPIPPGVDAVTMFEKTVFTKDTVTIFSPSKSGSNIIRAGEDVKKGTVLAEPGTVIDAGLAGTLASQNILNPLVYKKPLIGIISTGSELVEVGEALSPGKIYNSNCHTFSAVLTKLGCEVMYLGIAADSVEAISRLIDKGLCSCDGLIITGGVSVGDYDMTPAAMEMSGIKILFRGIDIKPGMACAYGEKDGKLICGLSGNPASALTNFYAAAMPAIHKLCGQRDPVPQEIEVTLANGFRKKSSGTKFLRGTLDLSSGAVFMRLPADQGNVILSSAIGCDVIAVVPAGSGPLDAGTKLKGFLI